MSEENERKITHLAKKLYYALTDLQTETTQKDKQYGVPLSEGEAITDRRVLAVLAEARPILDPLPEDELPLPVAVSSPETDVRVTQFSIRVKTKKSQQSDARDMYTLFAVYADGTEVSVGDYITLEEAAEDLHRYRNEPYAVYSCQDQRCFVTTFDKRGDIWGHDVAGPMYGEDAELFVEALNALHLANRQLNVIGGLGDTDESDTVRASGDPAHRAIREVLRKTRLLGRGDRTANIPSPEND